MSGKGNNYRGRGVGVTGGGPTGSDRSPGVPMDLDRDSAGPDAGFLVSRVLYPQSQNNRALDDTGPSAGVGRPLLLSSGLPP